MSGNVVVGMEIGNEVAAAASSQWTVIDGMTGASQNYANEPTKDDLIAFKNRQGYSSIKIVTKDAEKKVITVRALDKSGAGVSVGEELSDTTPTGSGWTVIDGMTGVSQNYAAEPTKDDLIAFKNRQGYSSIKIVTRTRRRK